MFLVIAMMLGLGIASAQERPPDVSSPWLALGGLPPEGGAIGVLNVFPAAESGVMHVFWATSKTWEEVGADHLVAGEAYSLNASDNCKKVLVYDLRGEWALVHGREPSRGWAWVSTRRENRFCRTEEVISLLEAHLRQRVRAWKELGARTREGFLSSDEYLFVALPGQSIRDEPEDGAKVIDSVPSLWRWQSARWKDDDSLTSVARLQVVGDAGEDTKVPLRVWEMRGDWLLVQLPRAGTPAYTDLDLRENPIEEIVRSLICWDSGRKGWVRWRKPGPLPGTYLHLIEDVADPPLGE